MRRQCVFSNDELLYRLAEVVSGRRKMSDVANYTEMAAQRYRDHESSTRTCFEVEDLRVIHSEFATVVGQEVRARQSLIPLVARAVSFPVYQLAAKEDEEDDDDRICAVCQTTLFFSAIVCPCKAPPDLTKKREQDQKKRDSQPGKC